MGIKEWWAKKKAEGVQAPNEFRFERTQGLPIGDAGEIVSHMTKIFIEETNLTITRTRKIWFFKGKPNTIVVNFDDIDRVALKIQFTKIELITSIVSSILALVMLQIYLVPIFVLFFLFMSGYGKNMFIFCKDGSKVIIRRGGAWNSGHTGFLNKGKKEFDSMISMLTEKIGRQVYSAPEKKQK